MTNYTARIRGLREKAGKSQAEMAAILDMTEMSYFDLEFHEDELTSVPSLHQVRRLAAALGIPSVMLLAEPGAPLPSHRITYPEMVERITEHLTRSGVGMHEFEGEVGWSLADFMLSEQQALDSYNLDFLKSLSTCLGVNWLEVLP